MTAPVGNTTTPTQNSASSKTLSLTKPTVGGSPAVGETLGAWINYNGSAAPTGLTLPSVRWSIKATLAWDANTENQQWYAECVVTSSEVSAANFSFVVTGGGTVNVTSGFMDRITGADTVSPSVAYATQRTTSGTTGNFPSVTTTTADNLIIGSGEAVYTAAPSGTQWNTAVPSGTTILATRNVAGVVYFGLIRYIQTTAGATGTKTVPTRTLTTANAFESIVVAFQPPVGGSPYTLTAGSGSYALSGTVAALKRSRLLDAGTGSYALTGSANALKVGRRLIAASGSYTLSGTATGLIYARSMAAISGSYALTGTAVTLTKSSGTAYNLAAGAGAYSLTGSAVALKAAHRLIAASGSYALSGTPTALLFKRRLTAASGAYSLSGTAVLLRKGRTLAAAAGAYLLSGTALKFRRTYVLAAAPGSYGLLGSNVVFNWSGQSFWTPVAPISEAWTPQPATGETWTPVTPAAGSWSVSTATAEIWTPVDPNPEPWTPQ